MKHQKREYMETPSGNKATNQYLIRENNKVYFYSYDTLIGVKKKPNAGIYLSKEYWDYSSTTSKYRNAWLGLSTKETERAIKNGHIKVVSDELLAVL